jgi:stalled ribosome rescue protein Dom34
MSKHAIVWIDQAEARVFHVDPDNFDESTIHSPKHHVNRQPKGRDGTEDHPDDAKRFFREVAHALEGSDEILLVGPSTAKLKFLRYAYAHDHALQASVVGVETVDHPTDGQLLAYARTYFKSVDRMR